MRGRGWLLAGAGAAIGVMLVAGVALAGSGEDGTRTAFLDRVAQKLGIERNQLDQAIRDARSDQIDEALAAGELSEERANALRERLENVPAERQFFGAPGMQRGERFKHGLGHGLGRLKFGVGAGQERLAEFLGIEKQQLREELSADGATLATVAEAHGKSREELKSFLAGQAQEMLATAVSNGKMPQERADQALAQLNEHLDAVIDSAFSRGIAKLKAGEMRPWHMSPESDSEGSIVPAEPSTISRS